VDTNIKEVQSGLAHGGIDSGIPQFMNTFDWWLGQVCCDNSPWNYKALGGQYDDLGNFNFGATGAALGIPDNLLLRGAGMAKWWKRSPDPDGNPLFGPYPQYGNALKKQQMILEGIRYFKDGCMHP
jgi:hypothetical protein